MLRAEWVVVREQSCNLEGCCLSPIRRNSVLDESVDSDKIGGLSFLYNNSATSIFEREKKYCADIITHYKEMFYA